MPNKKTGRPLTTGEEINQEIRHYFNSRSEKEAVRVVTTADVSLGLQGSLSQDSSVPSMGALQTSLYSWYPLTTLNIVNACTIFRGTRDDEINDCGLFKFSVAHCN